MYILFNSNENWKNATESFENNFTLTRNST